MAKDTRNKPRRSDPHAPAGPGVPKPGATPRLSRAVQAELGERLRHFYETLKLGEQPVPERFIEIIDRLEAAAHREKRS